MQLINWELLKNPLNWVIVWTLVFVASYLVTLIDPLKTRG